MVLVKLYQKDNLKVQYIDMTEGQLYVLMNKLCTNISYERITDINLVKRILGQESYFSNHDFISEINSKKQDSRKDILASAISVITFAYFVSKCDVPEVDIGPLFIKLFNECLKQYK